MRMLRRWWDDLTFAWAESTGRPPSVGRVLLAFGGAALLVAALIAALLRTGGVPPSDATAQAQSLNRNFGPGWHCTHVPQAEDICIRDTRTPP